MLTKILRIFTKIVLGLVSFYLIAGFILIPLVLVWGIPSQGSKFLKHPVHLRWVTFNPLWLQLNVEGFGIYDNQNQAMLGFDRLFVSVSPLDLFKKIIHVESVDLEGLTINPVLSSSGRINLLELLPSPVQNKTSTSPKENTVSSSKVQSLPNILIDKIVLHGGQVHFIDQTISPNFSTSLKGVEVLINHVSTNPQEETQVSFKSDLDAKGRISTQTVIKPFLVPLQLETTCVLNGYALDVLSPYVGKYTGHQLKDGNLDFRMDYRIGENKLNAQHKILIQHFEFGKEVESKDALHLPFGLAVALLEDPQGRINIALPVTGDLKDPKFAYWPLVGQVVRNFLIKLVTKPFTFLASMLGGAENSTDELSYIRFLPGKMDLSDHEKQKLGTLIKGLKERPRLSLAIDGSYDPDADWKAIQAETFIRDYENLRKISTRSDAKIYQQLYQRRFGIRALWALAKKYKEGIGVYKDQMLSQEIKRQLIENAPADKGALDILAQARSQVVYNFFVSSGFDVKRLSLGPSISAQSSMGFVPLQFTLTVYQ